MVRTKTFNIANDGWKKGINTSDSPYQISDKELYEAQNVKLSDTGNAYKRGGRTKLNATPISANQIDSMYQYLDEWGNRNEYGLTNGQVYDLSSTPTALQDAIGNYKSVTAGQRASMFTWKSKCFVSNGADNAFSFGTEVFQTTTLMASVPGSSGPVASIKNFKPDLSQQLSVWGVIADATPRGIGINTSTKTAYICSNSRQAVEMWNYETQSYLGIFFTRVSGVVVPPFAIHVDTTHSNIYITSNTSNYLMVYGLLGNFIAQYNLGGTGRGVVVNPTTHKAYVTVNNTVQVLDVTTPTAISAIGTTTTFNTSNTFSTPIGLAHNDSTDRLYVCDSGNSRVVIFNTSTGSPMTWVENWSGTAITAPFATPRSVIVDTVNSMIYVSDDSLKIYKFNLSKTYQAQRTEVSVLGFALITTPAEFLIDSFHDLGTPYSPTVAQSGVAGSLTGTYKYKCTFITATGLETSGGIESASITVSSQSYISVVVDKSTNPDVVGVLFYRTLTGGTDYFYVGAVNDAYTTTGGTPVSATTPSYTASSGTVTINDNTADGAVGSFIPQGDNVNPRCKYLVEHRDILFGSGEINDPGYLFWSKALDENAWPAVQSTPIGDSDEGIITGLSSSGDSIIITKTNAIYGATVNLTTDGDVLDVRPYLITKKTGSTSHFTIDRAFIGGQSGLIFLDKDKGPCFLHGSSVEILCPNIIVEWSNYDKVELMNAVGKYFETYDEYWFAITTTGSSNNQVWCYNARLKALTKPFDFAVCSIARIENTSGIEEIWTGDFAGTVWKEDQGSSDAGVAINAYITTGWLGLGLPNEEKIFDKVIINYLEQTTGTLTVLYAIDGAALATLDTVDMTGTLGRQNKKEIWIPGGRGKRIQVKVSNNTIDIPFEIVSIGVKGRIHKDYTP